MGVFCRIVTIVKDLSHTRKMERAFSKVTDFWCTHGKRLEEENGPDTFNYELVRKMGALHVDVVGVREKVIDREECDSVGVGPLHRKIQDVVGLQRRHIMQFEFCLDEFNRYLTALGLLGVVLCKT